MFEYLRYIKRYISSYISIVTNKGYWHKDEIELKNKYYSIADTTYIHDTSVSVIFMIDGRTIHGGLTDRLCGICSVFSYCQKHNIAFKINAVFPFQLQDYLIPNKYDWTIKQEEISYDVRVSTPVFLNDYQFDPKLHSVYLSKVVERMSKNGGQIHVYGNTPMLDSNFSESFHTLFKPSFLLQKAIDNQKQSIGESYIAVVTRFQQLLGDFNEGDYKTLNEKEKEILIQKCVNKIREFQNEEYSGKTVLCTSDSTKFLNVVSKELSFVRIIPGEVVHIDYTSDASSSTYMKSFVDMYMIAGAEKIVLLQTDDMYPSKFPERAAKFGNKQFRHIKF